MRFLVKAIHDSYVATKKRPEGRLVVVVVDLFDCTLDYGGYPAMGDGFIFKGSGEAERIGEINTRPVGLITFALFFGVKMEVKVQGAREEFAKLSL